MVATQKEVFHPTSGWFLVSTTPESYARQIGSSGQLRVNMHDDKHFIFAPNLFCKWRFTIFFWGGIVSGQGTYDMGAVVMLSFFNGDLRKFAQVKLDSISPNLEVNMTNIFESLPPTWIIPISKWLVAIVSKSPK